MALFVALALFGPESSPPAIALLGALGFYQLAESRMAWTATAGGALSSALIKLGLCYLLLGYTGGISSSYYLILLVPVITAATRLGLWSTLGLTALACAAYVSFLFFIDWDRQFIPQDQIRELILRVAFLPVVGFLTQQLAESNRWAARRAEESARALAAANRSLQQAEAEVRRSERLAALGQLTAGLAHELRNPLGTIRSSAELLSRAVPEENATAREVAGYITSEVDRANSLVTRFLEFARPLTLQKAPLEIEDILDRAIAEFEKLDRRPAVSLYRNYSPDVRPVPVDAELMQRVFFNLILNAAQATAAGGAVTVKTRPAGRSVEVAIIDRGAGIDPKIRESIFNPFFTTKPEGVGLGLAIVSKIVDEHGGQIVVESQPGEGSVFRVLLPME